MVLRHMERNNWPIFHENDKYWLIQAHYTVENKQSTNGDKNTNSNKTFPTDKHNNTRTSQKKLISFAGFLAQFHI